MESQKDATKPSKLMADDIWKEFYCPEYVSCSGAGGDQWTEEKFDSFRDLKSDTSSILPELYKVILDPVTQSSVIRICRLLCKYLCEIGNSGYKVKDLPLVVSVMKFLAEKVISVKEYALYLYRLLELCSIPPLLEKSSDSLTVCNTMKDYFTMLGYLLEILPIVEQKTMILKAFHALLLKREIRNHSEIKLEQCINAMERSTLPVTVVQLLQASLPDKYPKILELIFLLSSVSNTCSHRMLAANVLNTILTRMDLPYASQSHCVQPPDELLSGKEYSENTTLLIVNTLWSLLNYIAVSDVVPSDLRNIKSTRCALWGLCYAFKRQVYYGRDRSFNIKIRNDIAVVILIISIHFPSWNLISCGIAEAVIKFLIGVEAGAIKMFSSIVKFGRTNEDLYFEKTLLLIIAQIVEVEACIYLMEQNKLMVTILDQVNPYIKETRITWSASQFWNSWTCASKVLSILALKMPEQFLKYNGEIRLYMLLEWCITTKVQIQIISICTKTISTIILSDNKTILEHFRKTGIVILLIKLVNYIIDFRKIAMEEQRIMTLALLSIERLIRRQTFYQEMYGEYSITFVLKLLFKCFYQGDEEFTIDQRLILAIGSYIWECMIWCPKTLEKFIEYGAIYIILDIIETTPRNCRCLFLGILTDICDNYFCGPFLCTWRGIDKKTGLMSLLTKIWREEEIRLNAQKNPDGTTKDEYFVQMGIKQKLETYGGKISRDISPAIEDMFGSIRAKIYSICKIVERDNERYELAKGHYKMLHADLSVEDRVTVSTIESFFRLKIGQVWVEVSKYLEQNGINLLGIDRQVLYLMTQRHYLLGSLTKGTEIRIIEAVDREEKVEEKVEYARIRDPKLVLALDALDELDFIRRTTDKSYRLKKKNDQIRQVNMALNFPKKLPHSQCHRTFADKINATTVFNQHQTISSGLRQDPHLNQLKISPPNYSPCISSTSVKAYNSEVLLPSFSGTCLENIQKYTEDE